MHCGPFCLFVFLNDSEDLFGCSAKHIPLVAKDQRKEIVMEQLSQRHIGKSRNNDRSERESGRCRKIIALPSLSPLQ